MSDPLRAVTQLEPHSSDATFRAMFENSAVGIGIMGLDRKIIEANPAMCRMLGVSGAEIVGQTPETVTYPEDFPEATELFRELLTGKRESYWAERRFVRKNGEVFWAQVTMSVVRDTNNAPLYLVGMVIDIDDRKRAALAVRESDARFRVMFESSTIGMAIMSLDGRLLEANAAVCRMSGYTEHELQGRYDHQNVYEEDRDLGMDRFAELLAGARDAYSVEKRYVRKSGEAFWTRLTLSLVRDAQGQPAYLVALIEDIDEQKRRDAALAEAASRFRAVFDNPAVGVAVMTLDRRIVQINPTAERLTGYTTEEIGGINPSDLVVVEDRFIDRELFQELVAGERDQYLIEKRYLRKDGSLFWGRVNFALVRDETGRSLYIIGLIEDIHEEKAAQQKVAESEARFRAMYENAAIGISLIAPDGRVLAVNPVLAQLSGYSEAELLEAGGQGITHPEDLAVGQHEFAEVLAGKRNSFQVEKRYVHKDGRAHWMRQSISAVRDAAGKVLYLVVIAEDIDQRKRATEELRESEARFRAMYNNAAVGMAMMSLDRRILSINRDERPHHRLFGRRTG